MARLSKVLTTGAGALEPHSHKCLNIRDLPPMERFLRNSPTEGARAPQTAWRQPMKSILDPSFRYTSSTETDLRKTFARIRRERRGMQPPSAPPATLERRKVVALRRG
jgi:hypothetical protein